MATKPLPLPCAPSPCPAIPTSTTKGSDCASDILDDLNSQAFLGAVLGEELWRTRFRSTTVSDLLWVSISSGSVLEDTFWPRIWFCSSPHPYLPYPNMCLPEHSVLLNLDKVMEKLILLVSVTKRSIDSKLLFCYQSQGKKFTPPLTQNYQGYSRSCTLPNSTGCHSHCTPCTWRPLALRGSIFAWLNVGSLILPPKIGNEFIMWRYLTLTLMNIWLNTDLAGPVYSLFIFSLNYNLVSLLAMCSMIEALPCCEVEPYT